MTMELSQFFDKFFHLLMSGWIYGALFLYGVIMCLFLNGSVIHRAPLSIKEKSRPIRLPIRTDSEGSMVSSRRHPSTHALLPTRTSMYPRADAARNASTMNRG
jgi:hypothetical protein